MNKVQHSTSTQLNPISKAIKQLTSPSEKDELSSGEPDPVSVPIRAKNVDIEQFHAERRNAQQNLQAANLQQQLIPRKKPTYSNRKVSYESVEEECLDRNDAVVEQMKIIRDLLPTLLAKFAKVKDHRNPKKIKHKLSVLMLYGILCFIFLIPSRREANRKMTAISAFKSLQAIFPELLTMPHADTLKRLLDKIDIEHIEDAHIALIQRFIRNKKFSRYLNENKYVVAIDGTQKLSDNVLYDENYLQRTYNKGTKDEKTQYYIYVLEANLVFSNGLRIPLASEFLSYQQDGPSNKQDCESKAFKRLIKRIKHYFPRLSITLVLDGLYANGPIVEQCMGNNWDFMIVLKSNCLSSVWSEIKGLKKILKNNCYEKNRYDRKQSFWWANNIEYYYGPNERKKLTLHVVTCEETWYTIDKNNNPQENKTTHAWISGKALTKENVDERCNQWARHRWDIEISFLVEKHHGYSYEHCFTRNFNGMKGYHLLMRLAHLFNELTQISKNLKNKIREKTKRGLIKWIWETFSGNWLDVERCREALNSNYQVRLI